MSDFTLESRFADARSPASLFFEDFSPHPIQLAAPPQHDTTDQEAEAVASAAAAASVLAEKHYQEGYAAGIAAAAANTQQQCRNLAATLESQLTSIRSELDIYATETADALVRLIFGILAHAVPSFQQQNGEADTAALAQALIPRLTAEPQVTIKVAPDAVATMSSEIARLAPEHQRVFTILPSENCQCGDLDVTWSKGAAKRDTERIWTDIVTTLQKFGIAGPVRGSHA